MINSVTNALHASIQQLSQILRKRHLKIVTAESCTGGLLAAWLTELPGSSTWFECGFVTYSNLSKQTLLGIKENLIQVNGAVSIPVAEAMARDALFHSQADLALAITGIAGPDGGSLEKPVGTVCFAWAMRNHFIQSDQRVFLTVSRQEIRQLACLHSMQRAISLIDVNNP